MGETIVPNYGCFWAKVAADYSFKFCGSVLTGEYEGDWRVDDVRSERSTRPVNSLLASFGAMPDFSDFFRDTVLVGRTCVR